MKRLVVIRLARRRGRKARCSGVCVLWILKKLAVHVPVVTATKQTSPCAGGLGFQFPAKVASGGMVDAASHAKRTRFVFRGISKKKKK